MPGKSKSMVTQCIDAANGDIAAGMLLARVVYWFPRANRKYRGRVWVWDTREDWINDAFGSYGSEHTYKRAKKKLEQMGLIESCYAPAPVALGPLRVTHIRLTDDACKLLKNILKGPVGSPSVNPPDQWDANPPDSSGGNPPHPSSISQEVCSGGSTGDGGYAANIPGEEEKLGKEEETETGKNSDALKGNPSASVSVHSLFLLWKKVHAEKYPSTFIAPWTDKVAGLAVQLIGKIPASLLLPAMEYAISNWADYIKFTEETVYSAYKLPTKPDVSVLAKFPEAMVNFWKKETTPHVSKGGINIMDLKCNFKDC